MNILDIKLKVEGKFQEEIMDALALKVRKIDYVYHYTCIKSFLNMLKTNELWLSHASYMNDPLEIEFGVNTIVHLLENKLPGSDVVKIIEHQKQIHDENSLDLKRDLAFIFSMTENSDEVSPWMQYGDSGNGVRLEIVQQKYLEEMSKAIPNNVYMYFPVQYYASHFEAHKENIIEFENIVLGYYSHINEYIMENKIYNDINLQSSIYAMTKLLAAFIKNDFHVQEKEWRFVLLGKIGEKSIKIIPYNHGVKMMYAVKVEERNLLKLVDSIIIGPNYIGDKRMSSALEIAIIQKQKIWKNVGISRGIIRNGKT